MHPSTEGIILLHGLALRGWVMSFLGWRLRRAGYATHIISYPSRRMTIENLAACIAPQVSAFACQHEKIHFIGHSLGGIMIRAVLPFVSVPNIGRIVMLGTPHRGSEIVDKAGDWFLFRWFGPAGRALTTSQRFDEKWKLHAPLGIIAGDLHVGFMSRIWGMARPNDGKVSVASSHAIDETDHIVLPVGHTVMPWMPSVISQAISFIKDGKFKR